MRPMVLALGLMLICGLRTSAEVAGPIVGFVRLQVGAGPQHIQVPIRPFTPDTEEDETQAQMLADYLGDDFICADDPIDADWIAISTEENAPSEVTMMWRDQQNQWRDLKGNSAEPDCDNVSELWVDLDFLGDEVQTRELVLSGQVVW